MRRGVGFKNNDGTYIPPQLIEKLGAMLTSPLTLIEAGSGFGKTTAVAEVLEDVQEQKADVYWHTFLGEPPEKAWQALCGLIAHADGKAAVWLGNLGRPSLSSLPDLASILRDIRCSKTTVIVLDNWQLAGFEISAQLIEALSLHRGKKLHIVVITQPAAAAARTTSNPRMALIGNDSFRYTRENIAEFFLHSRITLDEEQLDMLCDITEGWIAALRLQLGLRGKRPFRDRRRHLAAHRDGGLEQTHRTGTGREPPPLHPEKLHDRTGRRHPETPGTQRR